MTFITGHPGVKCVASMPIQVHGPPSQKSKENKMDRSAIPNGGKLLNTGDVTDPNWWHTCFFLTVWMGTRDLTLNLHATCGTSNRFHLFTMKSFHSTQDSSQTKPAFKKSGGEPLLKYKASWNVSSESIEVLQHAQWPLSNVILVGKRLWTSFTTLRKCGPYDNF